jgi:hypothetical protein
MRKSGEMQVPNAGKMSHPRIPFGVATGLSDTASLMTAP